MKARKPKFRTINFEVRCFVCEKPTGETKRVRIRPGEPLGGPVRYDPCAMCHAEAKKLGSSYLLRTQSSRAFTGQKPLADGAFPSGHWVLVHNAALTKVLPASQYASVQAHGFIYIDADLWEIMVPKEEA